MNDNAAATADARRQIEVEIAHLRHELKQLEEAICDAADCAQVSRLRGTIAYKRRMIRELRARLS